MIVSSLFPAFFQFILVFTFAYASYKKFQQIEEVIAALEVSFSLPQAMAKFASYLLIIVEVTIAVGILFAYQSAMTWRIASVLLSAFLAVSLFSVFSGKTIQCNCFGETTKMGWTHVFRNTLLLGAALFCFHIPPTLHSVIDVLMTSMMAMIVLTLILHLQSISQFLGGK